MELWELVARESIRDLIARYNANGDSGRFQEVLDLFTEDGIMELRGKTFRGKAEISSIFTAMVERLATQPYLTHLRHSTTSHQIDILSPTEAKSRCYYFVIMDQGLDHWGRYVDDYKVVNGRWLFSHRRVTHDVPNHTGTTRMQELMAILPKPDPGV